MSLIAKTNLIELELTEPPKTKKERVREEEKEGKGAEGRTRRRTGDDGGEAGEADGTKGALDSRRCCLLGCCCGPTYLLHVYVLSDEEPNGRVRERELRGVAMSPSTCTSELYVSMQNHFYTFFCMV